MFIILEKLGLSVVVARKQNFFIQFHCVMLPNYWSSHRDYPAVILLYMILDRIALDKVLFSIQKY